jgi:hypothetical protein
LPKTLKQAEAKFLENIKLFESFNVRNRLYIDEVDEEFFSASGFGTNLSGALSIDYFINNFDLFHKFTQYFLSRGKQIINSSHAARIKLFSDENDSSANIFNNDGYNLSKRCYCNSVSLTMSRNSRGH